MTRARRIELGGAIAALAAVLTLAMTGTAVAAQWQYWQLDSDSAWDAATIDRGGNGNADDIYFDLDNDGGYDANLYNTRYSDSFLEVLDFDMDENDEVEVRLLDGDQREGFDSIHIDRDQDGSWDRWRGYKPGASSPARASTTTRQRTATTRAEI